MEGSIVGLGLGLPQQGVGLLDPRLLQLLHPHLPPAAPHEFASPQCPPLVARPIDMPALALSVRARTRQPVISTITSDAHTFDPYPRPPIRVSDSG
jgi:hypothetical protein